MSTLLLLLSCAVYIQVLYDSERASALAEAADPSPDWAPDFRFRVDPTALEPLATAALEEALGGRKRSLEIEGPLGIDGTLTPTLRVESLSLTAGEGCGGCLSIAADLAGKGHWEVGRASGDAPLEAHLAGTIAFVVQREGETWKVDGHVESLQRVALASTRLGKLEAGDTLKRWIEAAAQASEPFPLGDLGASGGGGPGVRALRLDVAGGALEVQGLLDVAEGGSVAASNRPLDDDWELRLSQRSALALMRRAAFERGTLEHDVAVDPRSLEAHGSRFAMDLRLWRLSGNGWWRDYQVSGTMGVTSRKLRLEATGATEGDKSRGAGLADPLALLAEGRILEAVTAGCRAALPAQRTTDVAKVRTKVTTSSVEGESDAIVLRGSLTTKR